MRRSLRLRRWQKEALDALRAVDSRDFLAVATPGAGKTTFALTAVVQDLASFPHRRVVVVAPTSHLKYQWATAAGRFGLHLEPEWQAAGGWPHDFHGVVVTYQQVAADPRAIRAFTEDAFVVLDEIHHAGSERAWGDGVFIAFEPAARRLSLSGTPFRSDQNPIPFVTYNVERRSEPEVERRSEPEVERRSEPGIERRSEPGIERRSELAGAEAVADYVYGYGEALAEGGVVRPVFFPRFDGHMEWSTPDGAIVSATFGDNLDRTLSSQRLRTALSLDGEWLPAVLGKAHDQLARLREHDPRAGGLVIAMDVDHARGIAELLRARHGVEAVVATSDDPSASEKIAAFADGHGAWIVAVRMVSEGVDIPRLRVAVYATNTVTELFFRQAVGRVVRWVPGQRRQKSFVFIPDDLRLRVFASGLAEQRTHSLKRREDEGEQPPVELDEQLADPGDQMSLFQAISATALDGEEPSGGVFDDAHAEDLIHEDDDTFGFELELPSPPPRTAAGDLGRDAGVPRTQLRRELRQANSDRVHMLVNLTGLSPREVNGKLNAASGVSSVEEATLKQLQARLREADSWLARV